MTNLPIVPVGILKNCIELLYICALPSHQYNLEFLGEDSCYRSTGNLLYGNALP